MRNSKDWTWLIAAIPFTVVAFVMGCSDESQPEPVVRDDPDTANVDECVFFAEKYDDYVACGLDDPDVQEAVDILFGDCIREDKNEC